MLMLKPIWNVEDHFRMRFTIPLNMIYSMLDKFLIVVKYFKFLLGNTPYHMNSITARGIDFSCPYIESDAIVNGMSMRNRRMIIYVI